MGTVFAIISWLLFGLIAGAIARFLLPGRQSMNMWATIAVGIAGSFVGGGISYLVSGAGQGLVQPSGWIMSIIGAIVVLLIYSWGVQQRR